MNYIQILSGGIMVLFALYLVSLLVITMLNRRVAVNYFSSFASSAKAHYVEQSLRLVVGVSMLIFSESMLFPQFFEIFASIIIVSTVVLFLIPWTWHYKLGKRVIPLTIRHLNFYAISASLFGVFVLYCIINPQLVPRI